MEMLQTHRRAHTNTHILYILFHVCVYVISFSIQLSAVTDMQRDTCRGNGVCVFADPRVRLQNRDAGM